MMGFKTDENTVIQEIHKKKANSTYHWIQRSVNFIEEAKIKEEAKTKPGSSHNNMLYVQSFRTPTA